MKKEAHPKYQPVLFVDSASGYRFVCGSALQPEAKEVFEGVEYPVCYLSISSASHPFFTGTKQFLDTEGRVEKFRKRFERPKEVPQEEKQEEVVTAGPAQKPAAKAKAVQASKASKKRS